MGGSLPRHGDRGQAAARCWWVTHLWCLGAGAVPGQRERHAVAAQAMEQADAEGSGALHPHAALADGPAGPRHQPAANTFPG